MVETLPQGFMYMEDSVSPSDDVRVMVEDQEVRFSLAGATSFSYKVTAPVEDGPYVFKGIVKNVDLESQPVTGTFYTQVKVAPRVRARRPSTGGGGLAAVEAAAAVELPVARVHPPRPSQLTIPQ